jgi:hypothetical protein
MNREPLTFVDVLSDDRFAATQFGDYSCCPFALAEGGEIVAAFWLSKLLLELLLYYTCYYTRRPSCDMDLIIRLEGPKL